MRRCDICNNELSSHMHFTSDGIEYNVCIDNNQCRQRFDAFTMYKYKLLDIVDRHWNERAKKLEQNEVAAAKRWRKPPVKLRAK